MSTQRIVQPRAGETALQYSEDVLSGKIVACEYVKLACQRFKDDLQFANDRGIYYDDAAAQHAIDFFGFLRHVKGDLAKSPETSGFVLAPWQVFIVANLFGWFNLSSGRRRFTETHIEIAKKNGKSTLMAGIGLYMLIADGEPGAEVYSAACTKEQACIIFEVAEQMVKQSPFLKSKVQTFRNNLNVVQTGSKFMPLAADKGPLDGKHIHCGLIDELHEHPNRDVYDVIARGTIQRSQPLLLSITTAGVDRESICWLQHEYGIKVLQNMVRPEGENFFAFITCADEGDDWLSDAAILKANPNVGIPGGLELDKIKAARGKAMSIPAEKNEFLRKHLNVWTSSDDAWLEHGAWEKCCTAGELANSIPLREKLLQKMRGVPVLMKTTEGKEIWSYPMPRRAFGGLDVAECEDVVAFVLVFPPCDRVVKKEIDKATKQVVEITIQDADDKWVLVPWFWIPEAYVEAQGKKNRAPYDTWCKAGQLLKTPGNTIDQEAIRNKILELKQLYNLGEIGYDSWGASWLGPKLESDGCKMIKIPQRFELLSNPTKMLTKFVHDGVIEHGNNMPLRWMASNVQLLKDSNGNQRPDKGKSRNKIDGVVASVMAVGRAMANPTAGKDDPDRFRVRMI